MKGLVKNCIYCSSRASIERDHVPPQCLFSKPMPSNLITVPCCAKCNRKYGKTDERIRNILTSLEMTENHSAISSQLALKRTKSLARKEGHTNLQHVISSLHNFNIYTPGGVYLGQKPAFKLDQPIFDKFMERLARAFIFTENHLCAFKAKFEWKLSPGKEEFLCLPKEAKDFIANPRIFKTMGENIFEVAGWFLDDVVNSLWVFRFYDGIEFMVTVTEVNDEK